MKRLSFVYIVVLAAAAMLATVSASSAQSRPQQQKFCGDPTLIGDEPCLPPNWCDGPNGTYPSRLDGSCHPEAAETGPPSPPAQIVQPPHALQIPQFQCADGYEPVLLRDGRPACAGNLRAPE
jgi:hypothetical protein